MATASPAPAPAPTQPSPPPTQRTCDMFAKTGVLKRAALVRLLDSGLPRWLQGVEGDRALANHRFQGWLVKSLHPDDPCYAEVDLRAGDIVQKVNGKSIEKPEQAFDVAESLRKAPALVIEYLRDGKAQRLSIAIEDEPSKADQR
jgi:S1-C subfamily serine protease